MLDLFNLPTESQLKAITAKFNPRRPNSWDEREKIAEIDRMTEEQKLYREAEERRYKAIADKKSYEKTKNPGIQRRQDLIVACVEKDGGGLTAHDICDHLKGVDGKNDNMINSDLRWLVKNGRLRREKEVGHYKPAVYWPVEKTVLE